MSEKIQIFQNPEFGNIRTLRDEKGEALFCAKDVCDALGYDQTHKAVKRHVEEGDGTKRPTPYHKRNPADAFHQRVGSILLDTFK